MTKSTQRALREHSESIQRALREQETNQTSSYRQSLKYFVLFSLYIPGTIDRDIRVFVLAEYSDEERIENC